MENIELLISQTHGYCLDRMNRVDNLNSDNLFDDGFLKAVIPALYNEELNDSEKKQFSIEDLKDAVIRLIKPKKPTQAIAEDEEELVPWLDSSIRVNPENRFNSYKKLLSRQGKGSIVTQIDADTYKILDFCHNPKELNSEWDRRGLVYGHVQSGKTANYIGLINRAFDAGYKIVIVLTGMTEDLRSQTQRRIDEGVVGQRDQIKIGIGKISGFSDFDDIDPIRPATNLTDDLSRRNSSILGSTFSTREKSIWVIKKNKTVLENLIIWLDKQRKKGDDKINHVPFLVIDDEADNASIQSMSKKDYELWGEGQNLSELDLDELSEDQEELLKKAQDRVIKAINRNIRVALSLMAHKTFVAYTATPYSIINQSEKDLERTVVINDGTKDKVFTIDENSDLFPRHFIIPLTAGSKYLGIERIFTTNSEKRIPVLVNLTDKYPNENLDHSYFPTKRGVPYSFEQIPESLEDAILHFIITIIIRKYRGHNDFNTLLVHSSHLTSKADYLAVKIDDFIKKLQEYLPDNAGGYMSRIETIFNNIRINSSNILFKEYFDHHYTFPDKITKHDVLNVINSKMDKEYNYIYAPFDVVSYHSSKDESLKHKNRDLSFNLGTNRGEKRVKNYIVIGGNRLSRGLTLEGLTTSYFVRNSTRQDSLYQMARWFGYRIGFEDLVRIFLPIDQISWFEGVYKLEMDLRKDFEENNDSDEDVKLLPWQAVIKMAFHTKEDMHIRKEVRKKFPAICDPNKLRNTSKKQFAKTGTTKTNRILYDQEIQAKNMELVNSFLQKVKMDSNSKLFDVTNPRVPELFKNDKNVNYENVNFKYIIELLKSYQGPEKIMEELFATATFIEKNSKELESWSLVVVNRGLKKSKNLIGDFYLNGKVQKDKPISLVQRQSFPEPGILYFKSILDQQKDNTFDIVTSENFDEYRNPPSPMTQAKLVKKYRNEAKKPLLLVYPAYSNVKHARELLEFPLIYCFIPILENSVKITYIVRNK